MSDINDDGASAETRQRLWPLFTVALALLTVGFYLALSGDAESSDAAMATSKTDAIAGLDVPKSAVNTTGPPIELRRRKTGSRPIELQLRQHSERPGSDGSNATIDTTLGLQVSESVTSAERAKTAAARGPGGANSVAIIRRYERARVQVTDDDHPVGRDITSQVETLLGGTVTKTVVQPSGEIVEFDWQKVPNPQARQMLMLVRDAQAFLTPRFVGGAVNPGDTWTYERPLAAKQPTSDLVADGTVTVDNRFVGTTQVGEHRLAVIEQTLDGRATGRASDDTKYASTFEMSGDGHATLLVDIDTGGVWAGDVTFERTLEVKTNGDSVAQSSQIFLGLRPPDGVTFADQTPDAPNTPSASNGDPR